MKTIAIIETSIILKYVLGYCEDEQTYVLVTPSLTPSAISIIDKLNGAGCSKILIVNCANCAKKLSEDVEWHTAIDDITAHCDCDETDC